MQLFIENVSKLFKVHRTFYLMGITQNSLSNRDNVMLRTYVVNISFCG